MCTYCENSSVNIIPYCEYVFLCDIIAIRLFDVIRCDRNEGEAKCMQNTLFTSAVTGDEKLRTDVIAIVQNEITVVDAET